MLTHEQLKKTMLRNPEVKKQYENPDLEFKILDVFLKARKAAGMTQEDVAREMHTSRPAVARIESVNKTHSPSINTLFKYAKAVGCELEIKLRRVL